ASASAANALARAVSVLQRLFAPFLPFATEEAWSWWMQGSVHGAPWPTVAELDVEAAATELPVLAVVENVLRDVRRAKSEAKVGMKADVERVVVSDDSAHLAALELVAADLREALRIATLDTTPGASYSIDVTLAPPPAE
ncbi:MAG TPA: class I tRNA ligase family protein, partial [Microthrixaceae bacterium]|nr:class I tRNA ligase family protein [Microthrixaceae bacterium]